MRFRYVICVAVLTLLVGCQTEPPTVVYIVLSPTPEVTSEPSPSQPPTQPATQTIQANVAANTTIVPTFVNATATTPTPPPPNFPTPVVARIQVAEQLFERGRMFWLEPTREIWVLVITGEGRGTWSVYQDTWEEGVDPESDPSLTPPEGMLQPLRGFGKLWRTVDGLRDQLGWAVTPEFGYLSDYQYVAGGSVDGSGQYAAGPGYHVLYSLYSEQFRFNEADSTWQLGGA